MPKRLRPAGVIGGALDTSVPDLSWRADLAADFADPGVKPPAPVRRMV
jgi:hypothetical protein